MPKQRVLTSPVRLTGSVHPEQLGALVSIDAIKRYRAASFNAEVIWELSTLAGDAAVQRAVQKAVAREGDDRDEMGREGFAERAQRLEQDAASGLRELLAQLEVSADLDRWGEAGEQALRAGRVAFVRLYEAGLLRQTDTVVDSCPTCESVVDEVDTDLTDIDVEVVRIALTAINPMTNEEVAIQLDLSQPELVVGAVALAVPADLGLDGENIYLPLAEKEVPIVGVEGLDHAQVVVPGHDLWSYELARQLKLPIIEVLNGEGIVRHAGLLEGLGRYAARSAAIEQLAADGYVVAHFEDTRAVKRCYRCGTPVVPLFGHHWLLAFRTLVDAAMENVRTGAVAFSPLMAMDRLTEVADRSGDWVVSQQLWSGVSIPVATCLDCGQTEVSVEFAESCKSCMGTLQPHTDILDARFISAVVPLAMLGWPGHMESIEDELTTLLIGNTGLDIWALPIAALGLRLGGRIPFQQVTVHQTPIGVNEPDQQVTGEMVNWVDQIGTAVARVSLLLGDMDKERAQEVVDLLKSPPTSSHSLSNAVERFDKAMLSMEAGEALSVLTVAAREGVAPDDLPAWNSMVSPLLGL